MLTIQKHYMTANECELVLTFPAKYDVCPRCEGHGKHVNPNVDGNGISQEEFDADPDFRDNYFAGVYDVQCSFCKGERVVLTFDENRATARQRAKFARVEEQEYNNYLIDQSEHHIRMMESGGYY